MALGMLQREAGRYANTPETDLFLDRAQPAYVGGLLETAKCVPLPFWGSLSAGEAQNEAKSPSNYFAALYAPPARLTQLPKR